MAERARDKERTLSFELASEFLSYDPETGSLDWKKPPRRGVASGPAGCVNSDGYLLVGFRGHLYMAIHLIWLLQTGEWPENGVDHRNRDTRDDRWENLRAATCGQNNFNRGLRKDNKSGIRGVVLTKSGTFNPRIRIDGRQINLGTFGSSVEAAEVRRSAEIRYFGEFAPMLGGVNG